MRREACACGGEIRVAIADWDLIAIAVYRHNRSGLHALWRQERHR